MTALVDLVELVRAPAALTVPGDSLAGGAFAGSLPGAAGRRTAALLPVASACLYWSGMALNDWSDREVDRRERPERPIPSGRVPARTALGLAVGLSAAGVAVALSAGGPATGVTAAALAATVWAYDLGPRSGVRATAVMAATRGLDVLLGSAAAGRPGLRRAALPALLVAGHTAGVTALSRGEVTGTTPRTAVATAAVTGAVALATGLLAARSAPTLSWSTATALGLGATYAATVLTAQLRAVRRPDAATVRTATGAGIRGLVPLQGALVAAAGRPLAGLGVAAVAPVGRWAMGRVSPT